MALRAPTQADAHAVLLVLAERDTVDLGAPDYTLGDLLDEWSESGFELAMDARVYEIGDRIAGYVTVSRPATRVAVAPPHEGLGIGTALREWAEQRELELGWTRHRQAIAAGNASAEELLAAAGYGLARSHWRMQMELGAFAATAPLPAGVELRAPDPQADAAKLHELRNRAFAESDQEAPATLQVFVERQLDVHDLALASSRVAVRGDRIVGFLLARHWQPEQVGYIALLAVEPEEQGAGLGTALLEAALGTFQATGLPAAQLAVASDNPDASRLYERLGMHAMFRIDIHERELAHPSPGRSGPARGDGA